MPTKRKNRSKPKKAVQKSLEKSNQTIQEKNALVLKKTAENNQLRRQIRAVKNLNKELVVYIKDLVPGTADEVQMGKAALTIHPLLRQTEHLPADEAAEILLRELILELDRAKLDPN